MRFNILKIAEAAGCLAAGFLLGKSLFNFSKIPNPFLSVLEFDIDPGFIFRAFFFQRQ
ncbi:unnamed protein product, partial [marine sediment metagenome]